MRRLLTSVAALLLSGCYDSSFGEPEERPTTEPVTTTIAELRARFAGTTFPVTGNIVVRGTVTTCDRSENFYRTLCIEDDGAGLEVRAGIDHLHNDFPEGCRVTLRLAGLALGQSRGVLQAGRMPAPGSGYPTDYLGSPAAVSTYLQRSGGELQIITPPLRTIGTLTPALCGTLVRIGGLNYTPEELTPGSWAGYKRFCDPAGAVVYTFVRSGASFASKDVPAGTCTLTGILQYDDTDDGRYVLKLRDESDCTL